jgi:DNA-binding FrmR family transcriptional regulator
LLGAPGRRQLLRRDGRVLGALRSVGRHDVVDARARAGEQRDRGTGAELGIVRVADYDQDALERLDQLVALEWAHPLMLARLTRRPLANILPTSMTTDPHAAHFRHSYTKDKRDLVTRLRRIEGQARGIQRLVEDEAYCLDILQQVEAMTAAADQVALLVLEDHIDGCLTHAVESGQGQPYVDEVMAVVRRTMGRRGPRSGSRRT